MLFHHLAVVYFSFSWKRIHTERQAGLRTPATALTFNSCWLHNLFLDFEVCQNWKVSIYTFQFVRGVRESCLGTHGSVCSVSPPMTFFTSFRLKEEGDFGSCGPAELAKLPRLVGLSRSAETEVYTCPRGQ
jgi:hypothetical protein